MPPRIRSEERRLKIIALSAKNYTVKELSEMFNLCKATIRSYIKSYNEDGREERTECWDNR